MPRTIALVLALLWPVSLPAGSSSSLLDITPDGRRLLVANPDSGSVTVVDARERRKLHEIPVGDQPEGSAWIGGPLALATVYRDDRLVWIDADAGKVLSRLDVAAEPYGVVVSRDGKRAWVSHDAPGIVSEIDVGTRTVRREMPVGGAARGLALSADERTLYVTLFRSATLVALDLESGKVTATWPGHADDNLGRSVVLHPRKPRAYLPHLRSRTTAADGDVPVTPHLSICDLQSGQPPRTEVALDAFNNGRAVCNPWEAALSPDGTRLFVIHAGTNDLNVARLVEEDGGRLERVGHLVGVGQNPRAVRVSPDGNAVWIYAALDYELTCHDAGTMRVLARIKVSLSPHGAEWDRGKALFNTSLPPLTRRRWVACASCHPDGQSDQRVWQMPAGPRRTPALFGLPHTGALHWSADRDEVQDFEHTIRSPLMQGRGLLEGEPFAPLGQPNAGRSADLDALADFCNSLTFRRSPHPQNERGRKLFFSDAVGCAKCHTGPYFTDSTLKRPFVLHDVGTGDDPAEKMGPTFDTPTLLGLWRGGPYLHHGKAASLRDVLTVCNKDDRHGRTSGLAPQEIDDLIAFLKCLPYERLDGEPARERSKP
jgi:YVTN family beta-propeller protein